MPTSVPGRCSTARGFTLLEMLVALAIMGLFAGLVAALAGPDDRAVLRVEALRLAHLLELTAEEARLTGKPIAWTAGSTSYRFSRLEHEAWAVMRQDGLLRARDLPSGMSFSRFLVENMRPQGDGMRLEFSAYAPAPSFVIELSFGAERYEVAGSAVGEVRVSPRGHILHGAASNSWQLADEQIQPR